MTRKVIQVDSAVLDYRIRYPMVIFEQCPQNGQIKPDYLVAQITPAFSGYNHDVRDDCVVYDMGQLAQSVHQAGAFQILTCECGIADDVGIEGEIKVWHEREKIFWSLSLAEYQDITVYSEQQYDDLVLVFERQQYIETVIRMLDDADRILQQEIPMRSLEREDFTRSYSTADLLEDWSERYPNHAALRVERLQPYDYDLNDILSFRKAVCMK